MEARHKDIGEIGRSATDDGQKRKIFYISQTNYWFIIRKIVYSLVMRAFIDDIEKSQRKRPIVGSQR